MSKEELKQLIKNSVEDGYNQLRQELEKKIRLEFQNSDDSLLTYNEVSKWLRVSKVTLQSWKNKGILPFSRIGSRVYFKKSEVNNALKNVEHMRRYRS